ncbi:ECF-type sigma factor [Lysobacter antibioticus]|uniref:ECF-type sigma factor n=1 Tax=Lysobacter antibioticus TaxID=84531 RepID=UPI00034A14CB|nr:ECF-type sigma factor [Lysobacter antibioticus]
MPAAQPVWSLPDATVESVTVLLHQARDGRSDAWDLIYTRIYQDLHRLARAQLRQRQRRAPLSPTSLISEAWLKMAGAAASAESRFHLIALIARAMRYAILDETKKAVADKRGSRIEFVALEGEHRIGENARMEQLVLMDQLLEHLGKVDERLVSIVELRYFGGLSDKEIGHLLGVGEDRIRREWRTARSYLIARLGQGDSLDLPAN